MAGVEKERITVLVVLEEDACQAVPTCHRQNRQLEQSGLTGAEQRTRHALQ